jgi:hypothetical protein
MKATPALSWTVLVLESDPHRVLEGLAIAAHAIGAAEGYLYIPRRVSAGGAITCTRRDPSRPATRLC